MECYGTCWKIPFKMIFDSWWLGWVEARIRKVAMKIWNKSDKLIKLKKGDIIQKVEAANMAPVTVA